MTLLVLLPLLVLQTTTTPSSALPTCAQLRPLLALSDDALLAQAPQVWAQLPTAMAQRLRADASSSLSSSTPAIEPTRRAIALYCPGTEPDARLAVERVRELSRDERFSGVRDDDDLGDSLTARVGAWLEQLLESDAMIAFSEQTRTVYLSLLALVSVVVAWRLRKRPPPPSASTTAAALRLHQQRALRVDELLAHATTALDHDPRRAALLVRQALLVRVGEVQHDDEVLSPSRTTSDVCGHLPADTARVVRPVLSHFDRIYFGSSTTTPEVLQLRDDVVSALQHLVTR
jgi:hypothetical protein